MPANNHQMLIRELIDSYGAWFNDPARLSEGQMTSELYPYEKLFSSIQVNGLKLKNRIVMGPMGNISVAEEAGRPSNRMVQYFAERAKGGVGLITTGLIPVSHGIDPSVTEQGGLSYFPRIDRSRTVFSGWRDLAETCHAYGARIFIQLTPGLGRVGSPECLIHKWKLPVSASWNPNFYIPAVPCRPLTDGECRKIIRRAGQAAADAQALTIDGVYLHGHEGYLLEQMTNPAFNRRKLGRYADWQAFGVELVEECRRRVGPRYPIMYRIDLSLALNEVYGESMRQIGSLKKFIHERTVDMTLDYLRNLVKAGVDIFDVDLGCYDNWWLPHPPTSMPPGCFLPVARLVKEFFAREGIVSNAGLPVPVVAVGKLGYPDLAERALREGLCDMIMLARPLLADPYWPQKAYAGRVAEIVPCIGDQEGCLNEFIEGGHPQCAVNPRSGWEDVLSAELPPANPPRRIAVVGAGPAGVVCACVAARRGHQVTLYEQEAEAGGELIAGSVPKMKYDVANYLRYLRGMLERHRGAFALQAHFNISATPEILREGSFDAVVICAGGIPLKPAVPGVDGPNVIQAIDLLRAPARAGGASKVVVVGGGAVGCEVAYWLAFEWGKQVTVVEMLPHFMKGLCTANRTHLIYYMEKKGVKLLNCARLKTIAPGKVTIIRNVSPTTPNPYVTWAPVLPDNIPNPLSKPIRVEEREETLEADLVVLAVGLKPNDALYEACSQARVAPEIQNIGDSFSAGRVFEAVKAGYALGRIL